MAESIFKYVQREEAEVEHKGETIFAPVPRDLQGLDLTDPDAIIEQLRHHGTLLRTLQEGVCGRRIDWRSRVRPADLPPLEKGGKPRPVSIIEDQDAARERAVELPEPMEPPQEKTANEDPHALLMELIQGGYAPDEIAQMDKPAFHKALRKVRGKA